MQLQLGDNEKTLRSTKSVAIHIHGDLKFFIHGNEYYRKENKVKLPMAPNIAFGSVSNIGLATSTLLTA